MYVTRYNPASELEQMKRSFETFNSFLDSFIGSGAKGVGKRYDFIPAINTREEDNAYVIEVDLPGVEKKDIDIDIKDNTLVISGERRLKEESKEDEYYKVESVYGTFERSFTLPEDADVEKIDAKSVDGVLEVTIPKKKVVVEKPKKIKIK
jgi:HSP20 family protein